MEILQANPIEILGHLCKNPIENPMKSSFLGTPQFLGTGVPAGGRVRRPACRLPAQRAGLAWSGAGRSEAPKAERAERGSPGFLGFS